VSGNPANAVLVARRAAVYECLAALRGNAETELLFVLVPLPKIPKKSRAGCSTAT